MKPPLSTLFHAKSCRVGVCSATLAVSLSVAWPAWAAAPFTVNVNGTVTDATTSLVWDQCIVGRTGSDCAADTEPPAVPRLYDWPGALAAAVAANAASYKGFTDWRVPNKNELESITKLDTWTSGQPSIDAAAFPNTPISGVDGGGGVWSSTTHAPRPSVAWYVDFVIGLTFASGKSGPHYVRLVRSGQSSASFDLLGSPPDTTPPVTTAGPAVTSGPTQSTAGLSVTINEAGTGYWLLVPSAAAAPTPAQVVAGVNYGAVTVVASGNTPMSAATPAGISLTGLTAGTAYKLYFVAKDTANNLQAAVGSAAVTTIPVADSTPPVTTAAPTLVSGTTTTAGISVTINETGTGYWLLLLSTADAPTSAQVVAGVNYGAVSVVASGSMPMSAATPAGISLSGLMPGTAYKLYFVAKDTANNLQAAVGSVAVTTAATDTTPPITTAGPSISSGPTGRTAGISVTINEAGTGYWLLVPGAATAPTSAQVVAGVNYAGVTVVRSGVAVMTPATPAGINLSGLTPGTAYKLYFVAIDTANNLQASPSSVAVTTTSKSIDLTPILMLLLD